MRSLTPMYYNQNSMFFLILLIKYSSNTSAKHWIVLEYKYQNQNRSSTVNKLFIVVYQVSSNLSQCDSCWKQVFKNTQKKLYKMINWVKLLVVPM